MDSSMKNVYSIFNVNKYPNVNNNQETYVTCINTSNNFDTTSDMEDDCGLLVNNHCNDTSKIQNYNDCIHVKLDHLGDIILSPC